MSVPLSALLFATLFGSFSYVILCLQVTGGFPPILAQPKTYTAKDNRKNKLLSQFVPKSFALFVCLLALVGTSALRSELLYILAFAGTVAVCIYLGLTVRAFARENYIHPDTIRFRWPFFISPFSRWPMLGFDLWTIGWSVAMALLVVISIASKAEEPSATITTSTEISRSAVPARQHA